MMQRTPTIADSLKGFHTLLRYVDRDMSTSGERSVPWAGRAPCPSSPMKRLRGWHHKIVGAPDTGCEWVSPHPIRRPYLPRHAQPHRDRAGTISAPDNEARTGPGRGPLARVTA